MAVLTEKEYRETLKSFSPEVYIRGERVEKVWEHPLLRQTLNHAAAGCELAADPNNCGTYSVHSPLVNEYVSRIGHHIQTSLEDLTVKARLTREVSGRRICAQCMSNMLSVTWAMIHDIDQAHGTDYFPRYREFVKHLQRNGYVIAWGMMDPKGDRSLPPSKQKRPTDLRILERRPDGVVVMGAKLHTTYGAAAHEVVAVPCRALGEDDRDFAVSFAVPIDTKGVKLIARPSPGPSREGGMESPLSSRFIGVECLTVFDDVFVPEERIFMCGEWDHAYGSGLAQSRIEGAYRRGPGRQPEIHRGRAAQGDAPGPGTGRLPPDGHPAGLHHQRGGRPGDQQDRGPESIRS